MRIALAQLNPVVGDLTGNAQRILRAAMKAETQQAELVLTPELSLWGYPPRDLLLHPGRLEQQTLALQWLVNQLSSSITLLVGVALPAGDGRKPDLHNSIALVNRLGWRRCWELAVAGMLSSRCSICPPNACKASKLSCSSGQPSRGAIANRQRGSH